MSGADPLLRVEAMVKHYPVTAGLTRREVGRVHAVDGVSFTLGRGETLGLVGESGCGKTTLGRCVLRLEAPTAGRVLFEGRDLARVSRAELTALRRDMQIVFQDPFSSLNPRMTVLDIVGEALEVHGLARGAERERRVVQVLDRVGIPAGWLNRYPHEFSGGQRQRIGVARAIALEPRLVVCDEAVSALDVSIQAQVLNLLVDLRREMQLAYLFISHDLSVVRYVSHRIAVMYLGRIVEEAPTQALFERPAHPYTRALLSAIPVPDPRRRRQRILLEGDVPTPMSPPRGCRFHTRCPAVFDRCRAEEPRSVDLGDGRRVQCWLWDPTASDPAAADARIEAAMVAQRARAPGPTAPARASRAAAPSALPYDRQRIETRPSVRPRLSAALLAAGALALVAGAPGWGIALGLAGALLHPAATGARRRRWLAGVVAAGLALLGVGQGLRASERHHELERQRAGLEAALEARRAASGRYPERLTDLGWRLVPIFGSVQPVDPWGRPWRYRPPGPDSPGYELEPPSGTPAD